MSPLKNMLSRFVSWQVSIPRHTGKLILTGLILTGSVAGGEPDNLGQGDAGRKEKELFQPIENPGTLNYLLHLPEGYPGDQTSYPLLLFLHGIAQKGDGSPVSLQRVAREGPFRTMRDGLWDPDLPFIVVGPQSTGLQPWWRGEEVRRLLRHVMTRYRIDPRRRYLSARDGRIRLASGRKPIDTLRACQPALNPPPAITILDSGHGQWQRIYNNAHGDEHVGGNGVTYRDIYRWMLSHKHRYGAPTNEAYRE